MDPRVAGPWGLPMSDIATGVEAAQADLSALAGANILVTGGTGFLGSWLTTSLIAATSALGLRLRITILTRNPARVPLHEGPSLTLLEGDVRALPPRGDFDVIVHGAASSSASYGEGDGEPRAMAETIVQGTLAVLDLAAHRSARVLFLSSGAVYGPQSGPVDEEDSTGPDPTNPRSTYGNAKRLGEGLCAAAVEEGSAHVVIARLFSFVGPRLPLNAHFAAGNFLRNALKGETIDVAGDGQDRRSYLYAGDLPEWCWALLARGHPGRAYNVGSPESVTIGLLAEQAAHLPKDVLPVRVSGRSIGPPSWYVPATDRAARELGLQPRTSLTEAMAKTYAWSRSEGSC